MGWLDSLFSNYQFDPQSYNGGGGWLGPIAGGPVPVNQTQPPRGFPSVGSPPVAATPPPPSGAAPTPVADSGIGRAADQQNPLTSLFGGLGNSIGSGISGLLGQGGPGAAEGPSLLDRLTAGANNLTTGGNPLAGLVNALNGVATGQRTDHAGLPLAQQATMQALMNSGVHPVIARAAAINPDYLKAIVAAHYSGASTAQQPAAAQPAAADRFAGTQPGRMPSAGANAAMPPGRQAPKIAQASQQGQPLVRVATPTEAGRLPSGTHFLDPQGVERVVP
jgi:hypothetical protein